MKNLLGKFHAKFAYLFFICQENFMKNLLGKFHAELSQQRLASQAEPSQAKPSRAEPSRAKQSQAKPSQVCLFIFYLSGKFYEKFVRKISCRNCHGIFMSLHFQ